MPPSLKRGFEGFLRLTALCPAVPQYQSNIFRRRIRSEVLKSFDNETRLILFHVHRVIKPSPFYAAPIVPH